MATQHHQGPAGSRMRIRGRGIRPGEGGRLVTEAPFIIAKRHIKRCLEDPGLDADMFASSLGCSRATLYRVFADHGETVYGYILERRMDRMRRLLMTATAPENIADLCRSVGFLDPSSFGRVFKRRFGMNPGQIRHKAIL